MHPRNRYKICKPDFEKLGEKYPEFQAHLTKNEKGKLILDFKDPDSIKILTTCLLKEDYNINIDIPPDRLVPTLPLRLNYVHWIEDITNFWSKKQLKGIDIGKNFTFCFSENSCKWSILFWLHMHSIWHGIKRSWHFTEGGSVIVGVERVSVNYIQMPSTVKMEMKI